MDIKLDDQQLSELVGRQILDSMSEGARDKLITDAIVALNKAPTGSYGRAAESPLQQAFNNAVHAAVQKIAHELVQESVIREQIEAAARKFITVFPEAYQEEALQTEVMAAVVRYVREMSRG